MPELGVPAQDLALAHLVDAVLRVPVLFNVDILAGCDFEHIGLKRAEKLARDVLTLDPVGHVLLVAGGHQIGADRKPHVLADRHIPERRGNSHIQQLTEQFDEHDRAAARADTALEKIIVADELGDEFGSRILVHFA